MPSRRTQPYRSVSRRPQSASLRAMQRGSGRMRSRGDVRRQALKKKRRRKGRARYSDPMSRILGLRRSVGR